MATPIRVSQHLWETPEITHINRLDMHSCLVPFADADIAHSCDRTQSSLHLDLNGQWAFQLFPHPDAVPAESLAKNCEDSDWTRITVWSQGGQPRSLAAMAAACRPWKRACASSFTLGWGECSLLQLRPMGLINTTFTALEQDGGAGPRAPPQPQ